MIPSPTQILIAVLMAIGMAVGGFLFGLDFEQGRTAKRDLAVHVGNEKALLDDNAKQRRVNGEISARLSDLRGKATKDRTEWERKFNETSQRSGLVNVVCPAGSETNGVAGSAGAGAVPVVRLSADAVRLWDDASAIGLPEAYGSWRTDAGASAPDSVGVDDIFRNHKANAEVCNGFRGQILGWQRWARGQGLVGP